MQQQQHKRQQQSSQRLFTASEVAEFEYCPLAWWHEQYEPFVEADTEELFAHMVELEHEHGPQATALPEYQLMEQLLVRRGAFEEGRQQHQEHADQVAEAEEIAEEQRGAAGARSPARLLALAALVLIGLALVLIILSLFVGPH